MSTSNEPIEERKDEATVKRQIALGIIYRSAALALFAGFILIYFPSSDFALPAVYAAGILYAGSVLSLLISGKYSLPLFYASAALAITVFLALSLPAQELLPAARGLELPVLITGAIGAIHCLSRAYSEFTGVTTRALLIAALGMLYYFAFTSIETAILSELTLVAVIGFVSAGVFSVLGILKRHSNERIAYIGEMFTKVESPVIISVVVAVIMTYVLMVRQSLTGLGSFGLAVIEWAALSAVVLFFFIKIRSTLPVEVAKTLEDIYGEGGSYAEKAELRKASDKVEVFVNDGRKEGLVVMMTATLMNNDIPADKVQSVISIIIDYEDEKEPPVLFRWAVGNIEAANRRRRLKAVNEMMAAVVSAIEGARGEAIKHKEPAAAES